MTTNLHPDIEFTSEQKALIDERTQIRFDKIKDDIQCDLDDSTTKVPGQNFVVVSFAGTNCRPISSDIAVKFWGAFDTNEDAMTYCLQIGKLEENRDYNIFVMSMYNWAMCPPDVSKIKDVKYHEDKLQSILGEHKKENIRSSEIFDLRRKVTTFKPDRDLLNLPDGASKEQNDEDVAEKIVFTSEINQE